MAKATAIKRTGLAAGLTQTYQKKELLRLRRPVKNNDPKYKDLDEKDLPLSESLKDTSHRVLPYWHETIAPVIKSGKRAIISAHGNSLRALVKYLDGVSDEEILKLNIPTGIPLVYELDERLP